MSAVVRIDKPKVPVEVLWKGALLGLFPSIAIVRKGVEETTTKIAFNGDILFSE